MLLHSESTKLAVTCHSTRIFVHSYSQAVGKHASFCSARQHNRLYDLMHPCILLVVLPVITFHDAALVGPTFSCAPNLT